MPTRCLPAVCKRNTNVIVSLSAGVLFRIRKMIFSPTPYLRQPVNRTGFAHRQNRFGALQRHHNAICIDMYIMF
jgi:hypothetical protein